MERDTLRGYRKAEALWKEGELQVIVLEMGLLSEPKFDILNPNYQKKLSHETGDMLALLWPQKMLN